MACRNEAKAKAAKEELEQSTNKKIFEILIMDLSQSDSVRKAVASMKKPVDAIILNAGGMGGKTPNKITSSGMNEISAHNLLGHVVLVDALLKENKLNKAVIFSSSEAVRGIKKMSMKQPALKSNSVSEMKTILNGSYFGEKFDASEAYGLAKYVGTLWMSSMARKHPSIKFISVSPGGTRGTSVADYNPAIVKFIFQYIMTPIVYPLRGLTFHKADKGAERYLEVITNSSFKTGGFYASSEGKLTGDLVNQFGIFPTLTNEKYQDNAFDALHLFVK